MSLDETKPADSDAVSELAGYIREDREQINANEAAIGGDYSRIVVAKNSSAVLTDSDLEQVITVSSASAVTLTLPEVDASDKGKWIRVHKLGVGNVVITPGGTDTIAAGSGGVSISNVEASEAEEAFLEIEVIGAGAWAIAGILGTWS